jgi:hypothetical protein
MLEVIFVREPTARRFVLFRHGFGIIRNGMLPCMEILLWGQVDSITMYSLMND